MFVFTSHDVLTQQASPLRYLLLHCLQAYLDLTMWQSLEVHTEHTISFGWQAVLRLGMLIRVGCFIATMLILIKFFMKEYNNKLSDAGQKENFGFPKLHAKQHVFDDIEAKDVLCNFTTRLFK
jgi:hypothetical protein